MAREFELIQDIRCWYGLRNDSYVIRDLIKNCCRELRYLQEQRALQMFINVIFGDQP